MGESTLEDRLLGKLQEFLLEQGAMEHRAVEVDADEEILLAAVSDRPDLSL